jgi:HSP20 family protein
MTLSVPQRSRSGRRPARRWDPVREMEDVYDRMGRLMQDFFGDSTPATAAVRLPEWTTPVDIEETDDEYIVEVDVPNVKREDINLELRDSELRISGEIKERERTGILRRRSRRVGQFEHVVGLPGEIDPDRVEATLDNGVLTVRLGKAGGTQPRRIEVKGSGQGQSQWESQGW